MWALRQSSTGVAPIDACTAWPGVIGGFRYTHILVLIRKEYCQNWTRNSFSTRSLITFKIFFNWTTKQNLFTLWRHYVFFLISIHERVALSTVFSPFILCRRGADKQRTKEAVRMFRHYLPPSLRSVLLLLVLLGETKLERQSVEFLEWRCFLEHIFQTQQI